MYGPVDNALDEDEPCYGRKCSASEYCCPGYLCVAVDDGECFYTLFKDGLVNKQVLSYSFNCGLICHI